MKCRKIYFMPKLKLLSHSHFYWMIQKVAEGCPAGKNTHHLSSHNLTSPGNASGQQEQAGMKEHAQSRLQAPPQIRNVNLPRETHLEVLLWPLHLRLTSSTPCLEPGFPLAAQGQGAGTQVRKPRCDSWPHQ